MKKFLRNYVAIFSFLVLTACSNVQLFQQALLGNGPTANNNYFFKNGSTINTSSGLSFVVPQKYQWYPMGVQTYQYLIAARVEKNVTLVAGSGGVSNAGPIDTGDKLLEAVQKRMSGVDDPKTYRFEKIKESQFAQITSQDQAVCVRYGSTSKDLGVDAKRGGDYSILEIVGLACLHPLRPVIVDVQYTRKAPPDVKSEAFESEADEFLKSIKFREF